MWVGSQTSLVEIKLSLKACQVRGGGAKAGPGGGAEAGAALTNPLPSPQVYIHLALLLHPHFIIMPSSGLPISLLSLFSVMLLSSSSPSY